MACPIRGAPLDQPDSLSACLHVEKEGVDVYVSMLAPWEESYDKRGQCAKKQRHHFANKGLSSQSYGFSHSHVWM